MFPAISSESLLSLYRSVCTDNPEFQPSLSEDVLRSAHAPLYSSEDRELQNFRRRAPLRLLSRQLALAPRPVVSVIVRMLTRWHEAFSWSCLHANCDFFS